MEAGLREVFADPLLAAEPVPDARSQALAAANPNAARAVLALYRAWRVAREDSSGIALPSGRRLLLPNEETRDLFNDRGNHFPTLEDAAEALVAELGAHAGRDQPRHRRAAAPAARAGGARRAAGGGAAPLRPGGPRADPVRATAAREPRLPAGLPTVLLEARDAVEAVLDSAAPTTPEAAQLIRIGLLNYAAGARADALRRLRRHGPADAPRHGGGARRFGVSFEQACHRLSTLQRPTQRGVPFFFLRIDPAGNVSKRFSGAGFPFARFGGSCPRWIVHGAYATPGTLQVQVAQLPDGATFLCFARSVTGIAAAWGEPPPVHVIAMGCDVGARRGAGVCRPDRPDRRCVGIGLSCRLCDRPNCRSRAFPPLEHRLALDPLTAATAPTGSPP